MSDKQRAAMTHEAHHAATFDSAKRLSDFLGMVVRMSFVLFVTLYFIKKGRETSVPLNVIFITCAVASGLVAGKMLIYLNMIMAQYLGAKYLLGRSRAGIIAIGAVLSVFTLTFGVGFGVFLMEAADALVKK